jgi:hypothetical protein
MRIYFRWLYAIVLLSSGACNLGSRNPGTDVNVRELVTIRNREFRTPVFLMSQIPGSKEIEHLFEIVNGSDASQTVRVDSIGCGCMSLCEANSGKTLVVNDVMVLNGGESKALKVFLRLVAKPELQTYFVRFSLEGSPEPNDKLTLHVASPVVADVHVTPPVIAHQFTRRDAATVEKKLLVESTVRGERPGEDAPQFVGLPPEVRLVRVIRKVLQRLEPDFWLQTWEATFLLENSARVAQSLAECGSVKFTRGTVVHVHLPITLSRKFGIVTHPGELRFGVLRQGGQGKRRILVSSADEEPFAVVATSANAALHLSGADMEEMESRHWIEVQFDATRDGDFDGEIALKTTHPDAKVVRVPVHAIVE